jgi:hypothetical protein
LTAGLSRIKGAPTSGVPSLLGFGTKPPPPPLVLPDVGGISTVLASASPTGGMGAAGGVIGGEHAEITSAKITTGTQRDLTITQNKDLLQNLYTQYLVIYTKKLVCS